MTPLPVPTSTMRPFAISDLKLEISSSTRLFGFGSRHQRTLVAEKSAPAKLDGAEQMLKRFARAARRFTKSRNGASSDSLSLRSNSRYNSIRFRPKHMCEQVLRIQTWTLDVVLLEIARRRLKDFEHSHLAS